MKKLGLVLGILVGAVVALLLAVNVYFSMTPGFADRWPIQKEHLPYFRESYEENREAFRAACAGTARTAPGTRAGSLSVASGKARDLSIDTCFVPSPRRTHLLIVTAGVHGGEGYASSAVQRRLLEKLAAKRDRPELFFVHGVNPFGMKFFRRVTENNVDLNRNHEADTKLFSVKNPGYAEVKDLLNPTGPVSLSSFTHRFFPLRAVFNIAVKGMPKLRQAVLQGQYEHPLGIYFGGKQFEQQKGLLEGVWRAAAAGRKLVLLVDLHTGYGERGTAHLFPNAPKTDAIRKLTERVFAGMTIDWGDTGDFYTTYGDFSQYIGQLMPASTNYVPMVLEFGTLDSQTTRGSIDSIHRTILENQSYHYGCASESDCAAVRKTYREMFYPSSPAWRSRVMQEGERIVTLAVARMLQM